MTAVAGHGGSREEVRMIGRWTGLAALAMASMAVAAPASAAPADEAGIRDVQAQQEAAWNAHDAHAYAQLFADDADLINVLGWWWKSRAEAERKLASAFAFIFAQSTLHIDEVSVRPLSDDLALAHVTWSMTGARSPDGSDADIPQHGIETQVLKRIAGRWLIISFQNTNSVPERPFPMQATHAGPAKANATEQTPPRPCLVGTRDGKCLVYKGPSHRAR